MPSQNVAEFRAWVVEVGGTSKAAKLIGCSVAYVSNIKRGIRKPGRKFAGRIQEKAGTRPEKVPVTGLPGVFDAQVYRLPVTGWDE